MKNNINESQYRNKSMKYPQSQQSAFRSPEKTQKTIVNRALTFEEKYKKLQRNEQMKR